MSFKTRYVLFTNLLLLLSSFSHVQAVTDAELEALEQQLQQQEGEAKRKAEELQKIEREKQRQFELEQKRKEEEKKQQALEEQRIRELEKQKVLEAEKKRLEEEQKLKTEKEKRDLEEARKKELEEKRKQEELVNFKSHIINYKTTNWFLSGVDYATADGLSFEVGMGDGKYGYGYAGIEFNNSKTLVVKVSAPSSYSHFDVNAFAGFVIDYFDGNKYTKRVLLSIGMLDENRWDFNVPPWGKNARPDGYFDLSQNSVYRLNLEKWAPVNWNGRAIFAIGIQNAGHGNVIRAEIIESIN